MRRLLLYATATIVAAVTGLFAWAWADARIGFITLGAALVALLLWAARRLPEVRRPHLRVAALGALLGAVVIAVLLPSTRVVCDCPPPLHSIGHISCNCPVDRHTPLRIAIAASGLIIAGGLDVLASRMGGSTSATTQ
ncbi:MAG: hypothetical protein HY240_01450 [Actinobacteria bacterium]|nr:hypothetical protein [Actinomycetota bacterium]